MFDKILTILDKCDPVDMNYDYFNDEDGKEICITVKVKDNIFDFYRKPEELKKVLYFLKEECDIFEKYRDDGAPAFEFIFEDFTVFVGMYY